MINNATPQSLKILVKAIESQGLTVTEACLETAAEDGEITVAESSQLHVQLNAAQRYAHIGRFDGEVLEYLDEFDLARRSASRRLAETLKRRVDEERKRSSFNASKN